MTAVELDEDIRDGLQEVTNIAVGLAADKIARCFSTFVKMPIPNIHFIEAADISMTLGAIGSGDQVTAVAQPFYGHGVSGEAVLVFTDASMDQLSRLMVDHGAGDDHQQAELVLEMASLLSGACIQGICSQLDIGVLIKHPELFGQHESVEDLLSVEMLPWKQTLAIELNYAFEGFDITCDLIVLFHESSLEGLFNQLSFLLE